MQEPLEIIHKSVDRKDMLKRQTEKLILKMSVFSSLGENSLRSNLQVDFSKNFILN